MNAVNNKNEKIDSAYVWACKTSMMELFYKNSQRLLASNILAKYPITNVLSVLNTPQSVESQQYTRTTSIHWCQQMMLCEIFIANCERNEHVDQVLQQ